MEWNKLSNNVWFQGVSCSLIATLIGLVGEGVVKIPWLSTFLSNELNISVYWLIIIIMLTAVLTRFLLWCINRKPEFTQYTQDSIWNYEINWCWQKNKETKLYQIKNIQIICSNCHNGVVKTELYREYPTCCNCNNTFFQVPSSDNIKAHIILTVKRQFPTEIHLIEEPTE